MLKIPKIPEKEELEFKEKEFLLSVYEEFQASSKFWFILLLAVIILAFPVKVLVEDSFAQSFISSYQPPPVNLKPYIPQPIKILKTQILSAGAERVSVYAQIFNPNSDISSPKFDYEFILKDQSGNVLKKLTGQSYLFAGESKFLLVPSVDFSGSATLPKSAELNLRDVRWTKRSPAIDIHLEILQKNTGLNLEKQFYVEGLLRNPHQFAIKTVELAVILFDSTNQNIVGVNSTVKTELKPLESRYFRVVWPGGKPASSLGEVQVLPYLNRLDPGLVLELPHSVPLR